MAALTTLVAGVPVRFAVDAGGQVYGVNGIDAPFVWNGVNTAVRNWGIAAPPAPAAGSTSGVGLTGDYYWQITWYNENTGEYGEPLAVAIGPITLTNQGYSIPRPSTAGIDSQITHWRLWRTTAGQADVFYKVADTAIATTPYVDNATDLVISARAVLNEHYRPDGKYPFIKFYKGRFILAGSRIESTGTITLTNGANTVAGVGTRFKASHVGQRLYAGTDTAYYTIATVTNATTATINGTYGGSTGGGKTFRLSPVRPSDIAWSQADSESFGLLSSTGVFPADGDFVTGLEVVGTSLIIFKRSHAYMYDYGSNPDPLTGSGNLSLVLSSRGLVRQECCVPVGLTAFCLDSQGIYEFDGASQEQPIDQAIRRLFQPDDSIPAAMRINRQYSDQWHGVYDQKTDSVLFFVTTGTETVPKTALRWSRERQQWTMDKFNQGVTASCQGRDNYGEFRAWVGDENEWIWALSGTRQCEGNSSGTTEGTVTASTNSTLTDGAAAFNTTGHGLKGVYVTARNPADGVTQTRLITANTGTQLTVSPNWTNNPTTSYTYVVGAVESLWRSVWHFTEPNPSVQLKSVYFFFEPTAAGRQFRVRFYKDFSSTPILTHRVGEAKDGVTVPATAATDGWIEVDASYAKGKVKVAFPENFHTCYSVEIGMIGCNEPVQIRGNDLEATAVPKEFE
jgi:hypothetical protein